MKEKLINIFDKIFLHPKKLNRYSPLGDFISADKEDESPTLNALDVFVLFVIIILPYSIGLIAVGTGFQEVFERSLFLLGIGLLLGFFHITLGVISVIGLGTLNFLTGVWPLLETSFNPREFWLIALFLLLPLVLSAVGRKTDLIEFLASKLDESEFRDLCIRLDINYASLGGNEHVDQESKAKALVEQFNSRREISNLEKIVREQTPKYETDFMIGTWYFLLSVPILLAVGFKFITSLWLGLVAVILYSLSFPSNKRLQISLQRRPLFFVVTITAGIFLYTSINLHAPNGFLKPIAFFFASLPSHILTEPLWLFLGTVIIFTLSGQHWSGYVSAIIICASTLGFTDFTIVESYWPILIAILAGFLAGISRILLWPLFSIGVIRLAKKNMLDGPNFLLAKSLLETTCLLPPMGKNRLLESFNEQKIPTNIFQKEKLRRDYQNIQLKSIEFYQDLGELFTANDRELPPTLKQASTLFQEARGIANQAERTCAYAEIIYLLGSTIKVEQTRRRLKVGDKDPITDKEITSYDVSVYERNENSVEIRALKNVIQIAYLDIQPAKGRYWKLYAPLLQPISKEAIKPVPSSASERIKLSMQTKHHLQQISLIAKQVNLPISEFPQKEQRFYEQITSAERSLIGFEEKFDFSDRLILIQSLLHSIDTLTQILSFETQLAETTEISQRYSNPRDLQAIFNYQKSSLQVLKTSGKILFIHPTQDKVFTIPNPWLSLMSSIREELKSLEDLHQQYIQWVTEQISQALKDAKNPEDLIALGHQIEPFANLNERYGPMIDFTITSVNQIYANTAAALAFPKGYSRELGLRDTLDQITALRQQLDANFNVKAKIFSDPLKDLHESILSSIYISEESTNAYRNPYQPGNPIQLKRYVLFKGREELAQNIVSQLRSKSSTTLVLYGPRRMGKTSFLLQLPRLLPPKYLPVFLDMQAGGVQQSDSEFAYALARAIFNQIRSKYPVVAPNRDFFEKKSLAALTEWLESIKPILEDRIMLLTIDEFEIIGRSLSEGKLTVQVLDSLRHLMQHNENMVLMFAGVQTIEALGPNPASYFISAYPIEISYLHKKEAEELIRNPDSKAGKMPDYPNNVVDKIRERTYCQPLLIQAICKEIIDLANQQKLQDINMSVLHLAEEQILKSNLYFQNIWDDAGKTGQQILVALASGPRNLSESFYATEIIHDLQHRRVIHRQSDNQYAIEIPLVQAWVKKRATFAI